MSHQTPHEELARKVEEAQKRVKVDGLYYHWRDPSQRYEVIAVGFCEWNEELCVVYRHVNGSELTWIRRLEGEDGWLTPVKEGNESHPRFFPVEG